jgi:hypothetical protein
MKRSILAGIGVLIAAVLSIVLIKAGAPPDVMIETTANGIKSLKSEGVEFLQSGDFRVEQVMLRKPSGETYQGSPYATSRFDEEHRELTASYPWGTVNLSYAASGSKLTLTMTTTNNSNSDTILGLCLMPITLKFPRKVKEYDGSIPLLVHNVGQVGAVTVSWGSGALTVVSEDIRKPLMVGFPWALNRPANTVFPLSVHTNRVSSYPDSYPTINRPIPPKGTDRYVVTLRFGRASAADGRLANDMYQRFAEAFPQKLSWTDRRPIGAIFLATNLPGSATNPRGWFGDPMLNVTTPSGRAEFRQRILSLADAAIGIMHDMNAQGAITWDIEGQEFAHATTYIGDPRLVDTVAPEMAEVADEYFGRIRAAGLRAGVCIRPQLMTLTQDKKSASQKPVADPAALLIEKIAYARKRWGVTLFYLDSNVNAGDSIPLDAAVVQKVAEAFPDCLLIPEHSNLRYYAYSAPFAELRHGVCSTPNPVRQSYPTAFSTIYTADGPLDFFHDSLRAAVKRGDSLMYRTWFRDPQNEKVKSTYTQ